MKHLRRRQPVVLEVAALITVLVATSGWVTESPGGIRAGMVIVLAAASISRLQHGSHRLRSSRVHSAGSFAALAVVAFALRATTLFVLALAVMAGVVWVCTNPGLHRALSARLGWRHERPHSSAVMMDEA
jgi:hypothetical protein